ncbi:alpha/beta hydrolase [Candidatus Woesearchaeota archaeon]|nr:alpha/beta hydrolase [Candidatus Woesearchaeota archaeon]
MKKAKTAISLTGLIGICAFSTECSAAIPEENRPLEQRNQATLAEIIYSVDRDVPMITKSGPLSTTLANPMRVSEKQKQGYEEIEFSLSHNVHVGALVKIVDPNGPYIISTHGFLSDKEAHAVRNYLSIGEYLLDFNHIIIDHSTSGAFVAKNGQPGLGGIEEGYILTEIAKQIKKQGATSIHLFGVSMGGAGVLHAAFRGKESIDSALVFSGVTDLLDVPAAALRSLTKEGLCGTRYWNWSTINASIGLHSLLPPQFIEAQKISQYQNLSFDSTCEFYLQTTRYNNTEYLEELYAPYISGKILPDRLPETTREYLAQSNAALIADHIEVPVFLVHAADDPVVAPAHFYDFMLAAGANPMIKGTILPDGGHNGFSAAYGKKWEACVIKTDVAYWSQEKVNFDKECF